MIRPDQTLRPLGLGEVLDRAVTLCVKHFVALSLIFVIYAIPYAVVQYLATQDLSHLMSTLSTVMQSRATAGGRADPNALANALASAPRLNGWYPFLLALAFFVGPLPAAALIGACAAYYFNGDITLGAAYRMALGRWLPLIGVNCLYLGAGIMAYALFGLVSIAVIFAVVFAMSALHGVGIALAIVLAIVVSLLALAFLIVATLAVQISYFTCVVEGVGSVAAFARGLSRVFARIGLVRSLLVGFAYAAIAIGIAIVALAGESIVVALSHSSVAGTAYSTIVRVATAAFTTAFVAIFYYDLRVREEGLDLALAADAVRDGSPQAT